MEEIGDELLVFDVDRQVAHSLNGVATLVWRACDGSRDAGGIAAACELDLDVVELTLAELANIDVLVDGQPEERVVSRRQVLRRGVLTGAAIGVALPVIRSVTAPSAALAAGSTLTCGSACTGAAACSFASGSSNASGAFPSDKPCKVCTSHGCRAGCGVAGDACMVVGLHCCFGLTCSAGGHCH